MLWPWRRKPTPQEAARILSDAGRAQAHAKRQLVRAKARAMRDAFGMPESEALRG